MSPNSNIQIVVASDNHYAILIAALLKSIDINNNCYYQTDALSFRFNHKINIHTQCLVPLHC